MSAPMRCWSGTITCCAISAREALGCYSGNLCGVTASSEFVAKTGQATGPAGTAQPGASARRRRWLTAAGWVAGTAALFGCYLGLASTRAVNSDGASQALQAWDMLHGNLLLRGWGLTDVSFYTTELPQYMLVDLIRGLHADVVDVAAAMTYTLVVVLAALLAKGTATGREALVRVLVTAGIMLAPQLATGTNVLLSSPDHIGTTVPVLVVWLILDRARARRWVPVVAGLVLAWVTVADTLVLYIGVLPLALVCAIRVFRAVAADKQPVKSQWYTVSLGAAALAGGLVGELALHLIESHGGFRTWAPVAKLAPPAQLPHHLHVAAEGLLLLGGADPFGRPVTAGTAVLLLHLVGVVLAGWAVVFAIWRFLRDLDLVDQVLVSAVVINLVAYVISTQASAVIYTREIAAVLPFSAVLAGRLLARRLVAARFAPVLLLVLAGYLGGFAYEVAQPAVPPQNQQLTSFLAAHHMHTGLSGYWEANVVTLTSSDAVQIRQVWVVGGRVVPYHTEYKSDWYDPHQSSANFVVLTRAATSEYPGFTARRAVLATFGPPAHVYDVGSRYQVLVWNKNLLGDLH